MSKPVAPGFRAQGPSGRGALGCGLMVLAFLGFGVGRSLGTSRPRICSGPEFLASALSS